MSAIERSAPRFQGRDYAAFLFDMDGTLLDSSIVVERVWRAWAQRHGVDAEALLAVPRRAVSRHHAPVRWAGRRYR